MGNVDQRLKHLAMYVVGRTSSLPEFIFREGIVEVVELFDEFTQQGNRATSWGFRRKAIKLAKEIFTGQKNWFLAIDNDQSIQEYNYQFIIDTVRFIATGKRQMHISSWGMLLTHPGNNAVQKPHDDIRQMLSKYAMSLDPVDMIQRWCSHPEGIYDLVYTLNYLFGDRDNRTVSQQRSTTHNTKPSTR